MVDRTPVNMELSTHAVISETAAEKVMPAKHPGNTPTKKVTPGRSPSGDNGNTGAAKAASPFSNEKTTLKQITVRMTPTGCCETPTVRSAIKNLFLATFKYPTIPAHHILKPSADANDMRLNLHEEIISRNEIALTKIDIVAETVAREGADLNFLSKNVTSV